MNAKKSLSDSLSCVGEIVYKPLGEKGEDAFSYSFQRNNVHTQAVFDGCGGAGAWRYPEFRNATGAFVSAQSMSIIYLEWFNSHEDKDFNDEDSLSSEFHDTALNKLLDLKKRCSPMGISGSLVKAFPCTSAIAIMRRIKEESVELTTLNAGDSRVYFLTPKKGLIQVTKDDSRGNPDPMESLRDNPPLANMLNADKEFKIKSEQIVIKMPCAVICATDGVFGYYRSPMDFEYVLLNCIMQATTLADFEELLKKRIIEVTGDDSTCIISFYGWKTFGEIQQSLSMRQKEIKGLIDYIDSQKSTEESEQVMYKVWESYKKQTLLYEM